ncbi:flotillin family protein [Ferrimonas balearica]|uniref:flotillin family protein n=1 Tax=Ferrimonas balearica TaxID=44012 RepID=UPI001C997F9B|nr:flotillin domain-containing protein [Ferrimonas balearica]MBY5992862.1 flotillin family protein [Ferrimonas balearica]
MTTDFNFILIVAGSSFVALLLLGLIFSRLYTRASKELSFVRTGFSGQKVIMNSGALVLPVLHEVIPVNMNTLRLEVSRKEGQALITKDRMRVDVLAEFYLRVKPDLDAIANAAQTLGRRTLHPDALKDMIEGKFVDALRSVAAEMNMDELHEQRAQFVQKVQQVVSEDLLKNGLELESVSLTGLDQTKKEFFTADNVFDAEGLAKMTRSTEARRKEINDIEQETAVEIERKNLTATQDKLEIDKQKRYSQLEQEREISIREAEQKALIAQQQHDRQREAQEAEITAERQVEQARIAAEQQTKSAEIAKEQDIQTKEIERDRLLKEQDIQRQKAIELAEQERAIAVAEKSQQQSMADKEANQARAQAVKAEEEVATARQVEIAERQKQIEIIDALKEAEKQATGTKVAAEAEKLAAEDLADARKTEADAEATAIKIRAEANQEQYRIDAEGTRLMNEALNALSESQVALKRVLSLHESLPAIIAESVKPMERIDGMKIINIEGLNGGPATPGAPGAGAESGSLPEALVNSALKHRAQAPLVDSLLKECGLEDGLKGLTEKGQ